MDHVSLTNFKALYYGLAVNLKWAFEQNNDEEVANLLYDCKQNDFENNYYVIVLQIVKSKIRENDEHFIWEYWNELKEVNSAFEIIQNKNAGNFLLNQFRIETSGFYEVWNLLVKYLGIPMSIKSHGVYNNMFAVSEIKVNFVKKGVRGVTKKLKLKRSNPNPYELDNETIYSEETGEVLKLGTERQYNSAFMLTLADSYILDVKPFLDYQYQNSQNKSELLDYIKYSVPDSKIIKHNGIKRAVKDWIREMEIGTRINSNDDNQKETATPQLPISVKAEETISPGHHKIPNQEETKGIKFTAKEFALAYLFDLDLEGKQVPINRVEGTMSKKELFEVSKQRKHYNLTPDSFYKAVRGIVKYDRNNSVQLQQISSGWYQAVLVLSHHKEELQKHLDSKGITGK